MSEEDSRSSEDETSEDEDINDYYNNNEDDFIDNSDVERGQDGEEIMTSDYYSSNEYIRKRMQELEYYDYQCLTGTEVEEKLAKDTETTAELLNISPPLAQLVLLANKWKITAINTRLKLSPVERGKLLVESGVIAVLPSHFKHRTEHKKLSLKSAVSCGVCFDVFPVSDVTSLSCKHMFCRQCWTQHIDFTVKEGMNAGIPCMENDCSVLCPIDFVEQFLKGDSARLYRDHLFRISVTTHYRCRFCPGVDCPVVLFAETPKPRRVTCKRCKMSCCFECGNEYHVPTDCETIKKWLVKCADDSETANYISANTKDCPACHICIEKNGGCNHIQCSKCKHNFCWMCLGDWKAHGNSYYECSKYKENPTMTNSSQQTQAREALKKYLFYFHRWENHSQSLRLESNARLKIQSQIEEKMNRSEGTWIDWQYLLRAGELLAKCRNTLHYTYPLAYYAGGGSEKALFEYQQAQLEVEIEGLAWKLEHAGEYQRGEVENQMDVCEKRTQTLLARFVAN
ncbi:unnamed protein product [Clavelina lepadiformis]|uniref:RBR-type E3 ubiquitin transferase n=1 Tax=Clavelina lepadiformis TaxID=159417 RepID=A0ABP0G7I3_CLALP